MKIKACASRRRPAPGSGTRPIRAKSSWHSAPGSPSSTRTVARDRPPSQRSATNRANVRYGTAVPSRASRSPILTVVSPPRTQARICSSRAHSAPTPSRSRPADPAGTPTPPRRPARRQRVRRRLLGQPGRLRRLHVPADRLTVHPRQLGRPTHPVPSQPDPQHFPDLDHRHLPVDHPPPPRRTVRRTGSGPRAPPPHDAPGGPMTGNRVVPCLWQNRGQSGPLVVAGDTFVPPASAPSCGQPATGATTHGCGCRCSTAPARSASAASARRSPGFTY